MSRLIFFCLIGALVYYFGFIRGRGSSAPDSSAGVAPAQDMVRCARCGLNLPRSEALGSSRAWACSAEHLPGPGA